MPAVPAADVYSAPLGTAVVRFGNLAAPVAPPALVGLAQYLTSDGGTAASGSAINFSGPTPDLWHRRLTVAWKRLYAPGNAKRGLGNWLDAAQAPDGTTPFASSAPLTAGGQVASLNATALVARWLVPGQNRGAFLITRSNTSLFPVAFFGRLDGTPANRPTLTVVTSSGTFSIAASCNAWWNKSSSFGAPSGVEWRLAADSTPAILRFDLSAVTGTLTSATLTCKVKSFPDGGSTGQVVDLFEADPPDLISPEIVGSPVTGIAAAYASYNAFKASGHANLLFADDFESPGPFDAGFTPAAPRVFDAARGTTYALGQISQGGQLSVDSRREVSTGVAPTGTISPVVPELFGQYSLYLEANFGTTNDDAIKIPAMGVQFGYWNPAGYWQQTTGNGGSPGTGLKVAPAANTANNFSYEGHSVRFLTGVDPAAGDDDPYVGWFGIGIYPYNLDQIGPFPAGEVFPGIVIRRERWYAIDIRVKQNTMSGAQDGLGNFATANPDGVYQVWINGYLAYSKTTFRWRRHADFGVQGIWLDVYHGGQTLAPRTMNYRLDRVALASSYIGPLGNALPAWVPAPGNVGILSVANGKLSNSLISQCVNYYEQFYTVKIVNDYSTSVVNPHYGDYGALLFHGGGHAGTNDNTVYGLQLTANGGTFVRWTNPSPHYGSAPANAFANSSQSDGNLADATWAENVIDGQPASIHSYGVGDVLAPADGGAAMGTFVRAAGFAVNVAGFKSTRAAHQLPFPGLRNAAAASPAVWARRGNAPSPFANNTVSEYSPGWTCHVPSQGRIYVVNANTVQNPQWLDLATNNYVVGTGAALNMTLDGDGANGINQGVLFHVPERNLLVFMGRTSNVLRVQTLDTTQAQPAWALAGAISPAPTVPANWCCACWCPDNSRIIVGQITADDAVYEITIPAVLSNAWAAVRKPFGAGQSIPWASTLGAKRWSYNPRVKAIVYVPGAFNSGQDVAYVYRPEGT